jgi:hypothetical protein
MDLIFFDMLPVPVIFVGAAIVVLAVALLDYRGGAKPVSVVPAEDDESDGNRKAATAKV